MDKKWPKKSLYYASGATATYGTSNIYYIFGNAVEASDETYFTEASDQNKEQNMKLNPFCTLGL